MTHHTLHADTTLDACTPTQYALALHQVSQTAALALALALKYFRPTRRHRTAAAPGPPSKCEARPCNATHVASSLEHPPCHIFPNASPQPEAAGYSSAALLQMSQYAASQGNSRSFLVIYKGMIMCAASHAIPSRRAQNPARTRLLSAATPLLFLKFHSRSRWESCWGDASVSSDTLVFWASAQKSFTSAATLAAATQNVIALSTPGAALALCNSALRFTPPRFRSRVATGVELGSRGRSNIRSNVRTLPRTFSPNRHSHQAHLATFLTTPSQLRNSAAAVVHVVILETRLQKRMEQARASAVLSHS